MGVREVLSEDMIFDDKWRNCWGSNDKNNGSSYLYSIRNF